MAKELMSIEQLIKNHLRQHPEDTDFTSKLHSAVLLFRKIEKDDATAISLIGGGEFRTNDAVMLIVALLEVMGHNIRKPERAEHFAMLKKMLEGLVEAYEEMVDKLDKKLDELEKKEGEETPKGEKLDA